VIVIVALFVLLAQSFVTFTQNELEAVSGPVVKLAESVPTGMIVSPASPRYH
jgi:hypothetical protein